MTCALLQAMTLFYSPALAQDVEGVAVYARVGISLLVVLLLIFFLAWGVRRIGQWRHFKQGVIQILGGVSLGPKSRVVLLQVEETRLLVGVTTENVTPLLVLSEKTPDPAAFQDILDRH